jgi:hypothetical protein
MNLEVTGKLIEKYDTQNVSDRFRKREFVLELADEINGTVYTNYAKMQLVQNKCDILDRFNIGEVLRVNFNIKGTRYDKDGRTNYFSNLDAWRVENAANAQPQPANNQGQPNNNYNGGGGFQNNNGGGGNYNNGNNFGSQPQPNFNSGNQGASQDAPDDLPF